MRATEKYIQSLEMRLVESTRLDFIRSTVCDLQTAQDVVNRLREVDTEIEALEAHRKELITALTKMRVSYKTWNKRKKKDATEGYVYLLEVTNMRQVYKIGKSKNYKERIDQLGVKLPFPVRPVHIIKTENRHALERQLHERYADKRLNGSEFFALTDEDITHIKSLGDED